MKMKGKINLKTTQCDDGYIVKTHAEILLLFCFRKANDMLWYSYFYNSHNIDILY